MALPTEPNKNSDSGGGGGQQKEKESMASTSSFNRDNADSFLRIHYDNILQGVTPAHAAMLC